jgi:hypothetical protein
VIGGLQMGNPIATLVHQQQAAGRHQVALDAGPLPGGLYICRLKTAKTERTSRILLLK